jgi:hypothetical protein
VYTLAAPKHGTAVIIAKFFAGGLQGSCQEIVSAVHPLRPCKLRWKWEGAVAGGCGFGSTLRNRLIVVGRNRVIGLHQESGFEVTVPVAAGLVQRGRCEYSLLQSAEGCEGSRAAEVMRLRVCCTIGMFCREFRVLGFDSTPPPNIDTLLIACLVNMIHIRTRHVSFSILIGRNSVADCEKYLPLKLRSQMTCPFNSNECLALITKCPTHKMWISMSSFTSQS